MESSTGHEVYILPKQDGNASKPSRIVQDEPSSGGGAWITWDKNTLKEVEQPRKRKLAEEEMQRILRTRRVGACADCRAAKKKCLHASPVTSHDQRPTAATSTDLSWDDSSWNGLLTLPDARQEYTTLKRSSSSGQAFSLADTNEESWNSQGSRLQIDSQFWYADTSVSKTYTIDLPQNPPLKPQGSTVSFVGPPFEEVLALSARSSVEQSRFPRTLSDSIQSTGPLPWAEIVRSPRQPNHPTSRIAPTGDEIPLVSQAGFGQLKIPREATPESISPALLDLENLERTESGSWRMHDTWPEVPSEQMALPISSNNTYSHQDDLSSYQSSQSSRSKVRRSKRDIMSGTKERRCGTCSAGFDTTADLKHHQNRTHGDRQFPCPLCERRFAYPKDVKRHIRAFHEQSPPQFFCTVADCEFADKGFQRKDHLNRHMTVKHRSNA